MVISEENQNSASLIDRLHPYNAKIKERFPLTKQLSSKNTYHVSLDLKDSGVVFKVGDSLGIYAQNDPILVKHLLNAMKAKGDEPILDPKSGQTLSIKDFLSYKANLSRLTSSFLKLVHEHETYHDRKNQLTHLLQKENKEVLSQYLQTHDPLDLLKEYKEVTLPLQELCAQFGPMLPRFYSVASSLKAIPDEAHLTVALFTFNHAGEQRFGVASHFLCHLAKENETSIPIYVQPAHGFTLPENPDAPMIMIGPGTGVAPFRGFMQERVAFGAKGKNWLFFGERNKDTDYFYEEYWKELLEKNQLRLDLAFSRDQEQKIYVQDKMLENAKDIWAWLQEGSYLFLCGDASRMAKDVNATLIQIAKAQGGLGEEDAKAYFKNLRNQKRFLLDVY